MNILTLPLLLKRITFVSAHSIYINAFVFALIIRDPASSTEEVSIRFLNES